MTLAVESLDEQPPRHDLDRLNVDDARAHFDEYIVDVEDDDDDDAVLEDSVHS